MGAAGLIGLLTALSKLALSIYETVRAKRQAEAPAQEGKEIDRAIQSHDPVRSGVVMQSLADRLLRRHAQRAAARLHSADPPHLRRDGPRADGLSGI
jgi:hypothetical protein